jgi:hypothetical protein
MALAAVDRPVWRNVTPGLIVRTLVDVAEDHAQVDKGDEGDGPEDTGPARLTQGHEEDYPADTPKQPPRAQPESQP